MTIAELRVVLANLGQDVSTLSDNEIKSMLLRQEGLIMEAESQLVKMGDTVPPSAPRYRYNEEGKVELVEKIGLKTL